MTRVGVLTEWDQHVNGRANNKIRGIWDFPESDVHYEMIVATKDKTRRRYKVHKSGTAEERKNAANVLSVYQGTMDRIITNMKARKGLSELQKHQRKLFLDIHDKYGHKVQEMNRGFARFDGMNKPYKIVLDRDAHPIGPRVTSFKDLEGSAITPECANCIQAIPYLRPTSRIIFVNARKGYNESLLVHEMAHTVANHVVFRPDDHYSDFKAAEKFVQSCL